MVKHYTYTPSTTFVLVLILTVAAGAALVINMVAGSAMGAWS